jgi:hypothetical protein
MGLLVGGTTEAGRKKASAVPADTTCKSLVLIVRDAETGELVRDPYAFLAHPKWEDPYYWHRFQVTPTVFANLPTGYTEFRVIDWCHKATTVSRTLRDSWTTQMNRRDRAAAITNHAHCDRAKTTPPVGQAVR